MWQLYLNNSVVMMSEMSKFSICSWLCHKMVATVWTWVAAGAGRPTHDDCGRTGWNRSASSELTADVTFDFCRATRALSPSQSIRALILYIMTKYHKNTAISHLLGSMISDKYNKYKATSSLASSTQLSCGIWSRYVTTCTRMMQFFVF